jgi:hypothetical protein
MARALKCVAVRGDTSMNARMWLCGVMVMTTTNVGANDKVSITVSPAMSFAPATLVIKARVEPDADNREMDVVADSGEFHRSSAVQLDGVRAPRTSTFEFRSLPPGEYEVTAAVIGVDRQTRALAHTHVKVFGPET